MRTNRRLALITIIVAAAGAVVTTLVGRSPRAAPPLPSSPALRDADAIVREFRATRDPAPDRGRLGDPAYKAAYVRACEQAAMRRGDLAQEMARAHPEDPRVGELLLAHWGNLAEGPEEERALREIDEFLTAHPSTPARLEILYRRALWSMYARANTPARSLAVAEDFVTAAPANDPRAPEVLNMAAHRAASPATALGLYRRTARAYPDTPAGRIAAGKLRQAESIGKPFDLSFADAVTGRPVSSELLRGRVVVVDFWARNCPPCVADLPKLRALYERYHPRGVEFVGIPLDEPPENREAEWTRQLSDFVREHRIRWPQYPPSRAAGFAAEWGVQGVPIVFVLDARGNLHSTDAREDVERIISELLERPRN